MSRFDLIAIGGGSGGIATAIRAARHGARCALIAGDRLGGTCVNRGCVPKKLLWHAAELAAALRDAADYGFAVEAGPLDWERLRHARDGYIEKLNGIYRRNLEQAGVALIEGHGSFRDRHTVTVAGADYSADHVVIAASSRVATETTLTSSKNPSTYGELIHYTATVTPADDGAIGAVGGTVQFSMDGTPIGDPVEVGPGGTAVSDILGSPEPGTHTVQAAYSPDPLHTGSGDTLTQTVKDADVTLDISSSKVHSTVGEAVHFTAALSSQQAGTGTPSGFVQFSVDGAYLGDAVAIVDGVATSPETSELAPGSHTVTALYSGSAHFNGAADSLTQQVDQVGTTTALTITPSSSTYGDTVTLGATVTPATTAYGVPVGTVSFVEGGTTLASAPLAANGTTSVQLSGLPAGSHSASVSSITTAVKQCRFSSASAHLRPSATSTSMPICAATASAQLRAPSIPVTIKMLMLFLPDSTPR